MRKRRTRHSNMPAIKKAFNRYREERSIHRKIQAENERLGETIYKLHQQVSSLKSEVDRYEDILSAYKKLLPIQQKYQDGHTINFVAKTPNKEYALSMRTDAYELKMCRFDLEQHVIEELLKSYWWNIMQCALELFLFTKPEREMRERIRREFATPIAFVDEGEMLLPNGKIWRSDDEL